MEEGGGGRVGSCITSGALRVRALLSRSERLGVGRPTVLEAFCVMSLFQ